MRLGLTSGIEFIRVWMILKFLALLNRMPNRFKLNGYWIEFDPSVSHPCPLPGLSFLKLFRSAADQVQPNQSVLEMGVGAGVWSFLCLEKHAQVHGSDLPSVNLKGLIKSSQRAGFQKPTLYQGDLFESVPDITFDHLFFNPPFHFYDIPSSSAYCMGSEGLLLNRFLETLPQYLHPQGSTWLILPLWELRIWTKKNESFYPSSFSFKNMHFANIQEWIASVFSPFALNASLHQSQWTPLIGRILLIHLRHA